MKFQHRLKPTSARKIYQFVRNLRQLLIGVDLEHIGICRLTGHASQLPVVGDVHPHRYYMDALFFGILCLWNGRLTVDVGQAVGDDKHWREEMK